MEGERWKAVRSILTPTFSSGKIKGMFSLVHKKTKNLLTRSKMNMDETGYIDAKNILSLYTMDVISSCAFGLDIEYLLDKNSDNSRFFQAAYDYMSITKVKMFKVIMMAILPERLSQALGLSFAGPEQVSQADECIHLDQGWEKYGPPAICGPPIIKIWPATFANKMPKFK